MVDLNEQIQWEEQMTTRGIDRYRKALTSAVQMGHEDALGPQNYLMLNAVKPVSEALAEEKAKLSKPGRKNRLMNLIKNLDNNELALIVSKCCVQSVSRENNYLSLANTIGSIIQEQNAFAAFKKSNRGYFDKAVDKVRTNPTYNQQKKRAALVGYAKHAKVWDEMFDGKDKVAIGSYMIKLFADTTGIIRIISIRDKKNRQKQIVEITDKARAWLDKAHYRSEIMSPVWLPMLVKPNEWTTMNDGGYYTKRFPLIKTPNRQYLEDPLNTPSKEVLTAINLAQNTGWRINTKVFEVAATLWEASSTLAELPSRENLEFPSLPYEGEELKVYIEQFKEEYLKHKEKRKEIHLQNARLTSKRVATAQCLETAEELQDKEFFYVWTMDWRGRMYPVAGALNPQGASLAKGLLEFSQGKPLGASGSRWLKITLANTFGVDKVSYDDRIKWVEEHSTQISMCAIDPYSFKMWADADSPWEFLAACFEWERYQREGDSMISHMPIRVDGSCNGLQHLSAALKDTVGCLATNVANNAKPSDIYAQVASIVSTQVTNDARNGNEHAQIWYGKVDRSVVKRNVMTVSYGATRIGMLEQLREDLNKAHDGKVREWLELSEDAPLFDTFWYLSELIQQAIAQVVKAAPQVMTWVQECAVAAAEEGLPLRWETPAGFKVLHAYRKTKVDRLDTVLGKYNIQHLLAIETQEMNSQRTKLAIAPNWVHSLDASHCHQTMVECHQQGINHFAMVHDSYGCHAADMDVMAKVLRQVFSAMYAGNVMVDLRNQIVSQVSPEVAALIPLAPPQGSFDVGTVVTSGYFFA